MFLTLLSLRLWFYYPAQFGAVVYALWRGAAPERAVAGVMLASFCLFWLFRDPQSDGMSYTYVHALQFAIDFATAIAFITIAIFANRMYTLWIAGFQIVALQAHLARYLTDQIAPLAYAIMIIAPSYLQIVALGLGTWMHVRRERRHGSYRSWRTSSFQWPEKMRVG